MNTPLRIILYGFYGVGELCDDFMAIATRETFEELSGRKIQWVSLGEPADLVVLGGGSLLGSVPMEQLRAAIKECPFCIFGTGVRDTQKGGFLQSIEYLWGRAASISVRGETSRERLEQWGVDTGKIETLGDPIFLSKPSDAAREGYIGGVIRPINGCSGVWMSNVFEFLRNTRGQPVKLFSFCESQFDKFSNELSGYENYSLDARETRNAIARASFWFGNRLHAFCLALIESVPAIGVEIEFRKVEDVCSTLDYPYWVNAGTQFKQKYYRLVENWDTIDRRVQEKIATVRANLRSQVRYILGMVKSLN